MALIVDQQQTNLKHFCRICKKGFGCGRALGGHMRAHGIGDDSGGHIDDEDAVSDWEDKLDADAEAEAEAGNVPPANKRMYALRTNPNRLRSSCRACENCGKEFLSWKSFLEHGKCGSEDAESLISSPADSGDDRRGCGNNWSKRKRSFRAKVGNLIMSSTNNNNNSHNCPSREEEDLANCLMMLSNATVDPTSAAAAAEPEESCASASKDEEAQQRRSTANFIAPISFRVPENNINNNNYTNINMINNNNTNKAKGVANTNSKGLFECKACKKVFNSHQALGGHRASHKKVKGCFAARLDHRSSNIIDESLADDDDIATHEEFFPTKSNATLMSTLDRHHQGSNNTSLSPSSKRKSKVHECSICHRIFSSGQALGGHKRCHWITSNAPDTSALVKFQQFRESINEQMMIQNNNNTIGINNQSLTQHHHDDKDDLDLKLDLNLPAPVVDVKTALLSTEIYLQPWIGSSSSSAKDQDDNRQHHLNNIIQDLNHHHLQNVDVDNVLHNQDHNKNDINIHHHDHDQVVVVEDEADSKVKLAKLSELKDMNMSEGSSPWLQVGIGSTTDAGAGP